MFIFKNERVVYYIYKFIQRVDNIHERQRMSTHVTHYQINLKIYYS